MTDGVGIAVRDGTVTTCWAKQLCRAHVMQESLREEPRAPGDSVLNELVNTDLVIPD